MPDTSFKTHTISVLVDNESGVLARVIGLFSGRGYNIDSLTVALVDPAEQRSRINVVTSGTEMVIEQIKAQLNRLVPVHRVSDLTMQGPHVAREMALVKVVAPGENRVESLRIAEAFRARVVDTTTSSFVFELTGAIDKIDAFIELMRPLGLAEVSRTGIAAIARGARLFKARGSAPGPRWGLMPQTPICCTPNKWGLGTCPRHAKACFALRGSRGQSPLDSL
jgi:acetolactate synthase-1/3 small subunit